jgi:hypothetical protein
MTYEPGDRVLVPGIVIDGIRPDQATVDEPLVRVSSTTVFGIERRGWYAAADVVGPAPATPCCDLHNRNCEPPSELCCDQCSEWDHPSHASGTECIAPDLSGNGPTPATPDEGEIARLRTELQSVRHGANYDTGKLRDALAAAEARIAALTAAVVEIEATAERLPIYGDWSGGLIEAAGIVRRALSVEATGTEQHAFKAWAYIGEDRCGQRIGPVLCCKPAADPIHAAVEATGTEGGGGHE